MMKFKQEQVFMLWSNSRCVVIGRNQNAYKEVNFELVKERKIDVVRRQSGGGAVFHDVGNFNFTFILNDAKEDFANFSKFTTPVVELLNELGVNAEASGRNDILIDGAKISGNAQYNYQDRLLHHGTLIYALEYSDVMEVLQVDEEKIKAKGVASVKNRITNVIKHMPNPISIDEFKQKLVNKIITNFPYLTKYEITAEDEKEIQKIYQRNKSWEYIYGNNPEFDIIHKRYIPNVGMIEIYFNVKKGIISSLDIYGDFFALKDLTPFKEKLMNQPYNREALGKIIEETEDFNEYFFNLDRQDFVNLILEEKK